MKLIKFYEKNRFYIIIKSYEMKNKNNMKRKKNNKKFKF